MAKRKRKKSLIKLMKDIPAMLGLDTLGFLLGRKPVLFHPPVPKFATVRKSIRRISGVKKIDYACSRSEIWLDRLEDTNKAK
jgi:hypothetical protein